MAAKDLWLRSAENFAALLGYGLALGVLRWSYRWWRYGERVPIWRRVGKS